MFDGSLEQLNLAREKASRLIGELEARRAEVQANPPDIPTEQLAMGRKAMDNAIAAARRSLAALEDALRIAHYHDKDESKS